MNTLQATIKQIESQKHLSLVQLQIAQFPLQALLLETPATVNYLVIGNTIQVLFKETEVILNKSTINETSIANQLPCTIQSIEKGKILSKVKLLFDNQPIEAILTTHICQQLQLKKGDSVTAMIKVNEIMFAS